MTEITLLLVAVALTVITATGAYKKRLKSIPFLISARALTGAAIVFFCIADDHLQRYHFIVIGTVVAWMIYDTVMRIMHHKPNRMNS